MRRAFACMLALVLGTACAILVACGGDARGLIGSSDADAMQQQLDQIESSVRRGQCGGLPGELADLQQQVNGLPSRVDAALRQRLQEGVANLAQISPDRCAIQAAKSATVPTTTTQTTPTTPTATTPTTPTATVPTTPTETVPTQTTPTTIPTTPPATEPPPTTTGGSGGATVPGNTGAGGAGGTGGGAATP
ncbi:hypothetical protein [Capillimicrobium parvum]|uniref:Uncharacterized protein n=1 Tax=Capillimicrobium parvum TaxID=2884022 RepID=A0A9E6XW59_9ACTN|nr:hypothetical protein [Capillimicrobium parvum]UGS35228.1 hypothetical protein DSM104329_01613 [Capillimicrobium parvum]